jgi:hypothetical protein
MMLATLRRFLLSLTLAALAPAPGSTSESALPTTSLQVAERGPHHAVVQGVRYEPDGQGGVIARRYGYTQIETGLHFLDAQGRWTESREKLEIFPDGLVARQGQAKLILATDLHTAGAVDLLTPEGLRLRSHLLGLAYADPVSGESALIAAVQPSVAELLAPNRVLYRNALSGDVHADYRVIYTKAGMEADVVLRTQPPSPVEYGLPENSQLLVLTEFLDPPQPQELSQPPPVSGAGCRSTLNPQPSTTPSATTRLPAWRVSRTGA